MDFAVLAAIGFGIVFLWVSAIAVISEKPQARVARALLASGGVVAGAWVTSASAGMTEYGDVSLVLTLLRSFG
jgi:hypothetical protein